MRLGIAVRDGWSNPAARVRAIEYTRSLTEAGVEVRCLIWRATSRRAIVADAGKLLALGRWADAVMLQRPSQPPRLLDALVRINPNLIVDFDDALWASTTGQATGTYGQRLTHAVQLAKHITPGSNYLADWARSAAPQAAITVIRPAVDLEQWPQRRHAEPSDSPPVIGWIGTANNLKDFGPDVVEAIHRLVSDGRVSLRLITRQGASLNGIPTDVVAWSKETEGAAVASLDIGLMPLVDNERSRGRCGYKAIQCLASGVPVVASPVGAALEIVRPGQTGLLARGADEWHSALSYLATNVVQRQAMGQAGRAWVEDHASRAEGCRRLISVVRETVDASAR